MIIVVLYFAMVIGIGFYLKRFATTGDAEGCRRVEPGMLEISMGGQQQGSVVAKLQIVGTPKEVDQ